MKKPHIPFVTVNCAIITISDSRNFDSDNSGKLIQTLLISQGHNIIDYQIIKDDPQLINFVLTNLSNKKNINVFILNGGTGISPRDNTYDVVSAILDKTLSGFGEIFRHLSYQEIGSRAMASRAIAGVYKDKIVFSLPGSTGAVKLGMEKLILPELTHLVSQLQK